MSNIFVEETSQVVPDAHFANSQLAEIVESAQVIPRKSLLKSILYEVSSWLFIPLAVFVSGFFLSYALIIGGVFVFPIIAGLVWVFMDLFGVNYNVYWYLVIAMAIPIVLLWAIFLADNVYGKLVELFFRGRRRAKRFRLNASNELAKTEKNPVLYLRSFGDDQTEDYSRQILRTYEEDLAMALSSIGPLVAIGKPYDQVSPLGATRIYLKNDGWQQNVKRLMQISQLIVLHAGTSEGLLWEIETAVQAIEPKKILISFLSWQDFDEEYRQVEYEQFKKLVEQKVNESEKNISLTLPKTIGKAKFMVFNEEWNPELVKTDRWKELLYNFSNPIIIRETVYPILLERNLKLNRWRNIAYLMIMSGLIVGAILNLGFTITTLTNLQANRGEISLIFDSIPHLLIRILGIVAYFIVYIWLINGLMKFIHLAKNYLIAIIGKIIPSRGSGLQALDKD